MKFQLSFSDCLLLRLLIRSLWRRNAARKLRRLESRDKRNEKVIDFHLSLGSRRAVRHDRASLPSDAWLHRKALVEITHLSCPRPRRMLRTPPWHALHHRMETRPSVVTIAQPLCDTTQVSRKPLTVRFVRCELDEVLPALKPQSLRLHPRRPNPRRGW